VRKLATIRTIASVSPIPDADKIEKVRVDGWDAVVKKGVFKEGDPCVYFEIDSFLPMEERYEFLRKSSYKKIQATGQEGFRLKTITMRGQISQGLVMPLTDFPALLSLPHGADVTEALKVEKYDPPVPACLSGEVWGYMAGTVPMTDQERIQNIFRNLKDDTEAYGMKYEATIKLDGTSMTMYVDPDKDRFCVCGRTLSLKENPNVSYWQAARELPYEDILRNGGTFKAANRIFDTRKLALQGEVVGPGIQENNEKLKKTGFFLFDIYDMEERRYLSPEERTEFTALFKIPHVPVVGHYTGSQLFSGSVDDILLMAVGPSMNPLSEREGLVFKRSDGRRSFKAISNKYLKDQKD